MKLQILIHTNMSIAFSKWIKSQYSLVNAFPSVWNGETDGSFKGPNTQFQLKINNEASFKTLLSIMFSFFPQTHTSSYNLSLLPWFSISGGLTRCNREAFPWHCFSPNADSSWKIMEIISKLQALIRTGIICVV